jgi:hypothetical protein
MHNDIEELRAISNFYYNVNGIYQKVCNYFAFLYRYDWYISLDIQDASANKEKALKDFAKVLDFYDNSYIKKVCGDIALKVIKNGCYYGYVVPSAKELVLQELPPNFCRSRYFTGNAPVIEFNMRFFDTFSDPSYRMKVLNLFPDEFKKGYSLYKQGKLQQDLVRTEGGNLRYYDYGGWYMLDPASTVKFNFNNNDVPMFINAIPALLDLDAAQDLDRRKQM